MIILIKLILAHFIGDFLLQPKSWVDEKEKKKIRSPKLYLHALIHGGLLLLLLWDWNYWLLALLLTFIHGLIDVLKLYLQNEKNKTTWFLIDQGLHIVSIIALWIVFFHPGITAMISSISQNFWIYVTALIFITTVSGIIMQTLLYQWSKVLDDANSRSLKNAGKYIGMLERLFVFLFVVSGNWQGIGFMLAAKSIFRFGDLKQSKDRKLTEYILIGTLLSFGIAVVTGLLVLYLTQNI
ncbi:uncharacterized protein DUF3307 [Balneicella halophila]|uniref:Uncharacterized protein DUF3307 n=1 Tax=Balneicella halophila TaxID=1537566 RepID=A0A7L4UPR8_BALHA|nr:DUF3307 domain-containing protein [Balneicella halophila]PVX50043.1 uncharacterized protein DUF3307 [Balneicella halophila]